MFRLLLTVALLGGVSFMAAEAEDAPKEVSAEITGHIFGKQIQRRQDEAVGATESRHRAEISQARETLAETLPHSWTAQNQASARAFQRG